MFTANKKDDRASRHVNQDQTNGQLQNLDMHDKYWDGYRAPSGPKAPSSGHGSGGGGFGWLQIPAIRIPGILEIPELPVPVP